jgi:hypothetical protein
VCCSTHSLDAIIIHVYAKCESEEEERESGKIVQQKYVHKQAPIIKLMLLLIFLLAEMASFMNI